MSKNWGLALPELIAAGMVEIIRDSDATYEYFAYGMPGIAASSDDWAVKRINTTTGAVDWADDTNEPVHAATDLPGLFS